MEQMHELPEYEDFTTAKVLSESLSHYLDRKLSKKKESYLDIKTKLLKVEF